jgi:hypothetical protein
MYPVVPAFVAFQIARKQHMITGAVAIILGAPEPAIEYERE